MAMSGRVETLAVGWRPGAFTSAATCAVLLLGCALTIHFAGLAAGLALLVLGASAPFAVWSEARLDGPSIRLRGLRTFGRPVVAHARGIDRIEFRRGGLVARLQLHRRADGVVLRATGPDPSHAAFRQAAVWLLVHGRRQARIDPALLDALASMPDHVRADQPHDASHA